MSNDKYQILNTRLGAKRAKYLILSTYLILVVFAIGSILAQRSSAVTMSNTNYILQMGTMNSGSGKPTSASYKLGSTLGQLAPGLYSGANYKIRSGFQYISSIIKFQFSIDNTTIDFGVLTAGTPVLRYTKLTISNGSANGYQVTAYQNHQLLSNPSGQIIPDTTCNDGSCTQSTSALWDLPTVYGFGYRCDNVSGTDCASGFSTANYYKQFADDSKSESVVAVMSGSNVGKNIAVQITYKVNVSNTQSAGQYTNQTIYVATPTF